MNKIDLVTREVGRIVDGNSVETDKSDGWTGTKLETINFNTISGRHEIECFFAIEFEQEQVDAWTTVQNIIDDVMNLWVSPITDPVVHKIGIVGEVAPEAIMPLRMENGHLTVNPAFMSKPGRLDPPTEVDRAAAAKNPSEVINRIERADVENFKNGNYTEHNALNQYQRIATKSAIYPGKGTPFGLMYAALGLAEAGEVQNKVKKAFRDDGVVHFADHLPGHPEANTLAECRVIFQPITPERRAQIIKELGGVLWYIAAVCDEINATMSEVALTNLDELCGRGERNTLRGDGDNR